jgi:hypothetical protein
MQTTDLAEKAAAHLPVCAYIAFIIWSWIILTLAALAGVVFVVVGTCLRVRNWLRRRAR